MSERPHKFIIGSTLVPLDRQAAYDIAIALTELYNRCCNQVTDDMQESTEAAYAMIEIAQAYNEINLICADIDDIEPEPIEYIRAQALAWLSERNRNTCPKCGIYDPIPNTIDGPICAACGASLLPQNPA